MEKEIQNGDRKPALRRYSRLASPYVSLRRKEIFNTDTSDAPVIHSEVKSMKSEETLPQDIENEQSERWIDDEPRNEVEYCDEPRNEFECYDESRNELEYSLNLNDSWEEGTSSTEYEDQPSTMVYKWKPSDRYFLSSDGKQQSDISMEKSYSYIDRRDTTVAHNKFRNDIPQEGCVDCNNHHKCIKHTGKKIFSCEVCGRGFTTRGNLKNHSLIHTNEKPWQCHICGKRFNRAGNMRTHVKSHSTGKPWQCEDCGRWFKHESGLRHHAKTTCRATTDPSRNILSDYDTYDNMHEEEEKYVERIKVENNDRNYEQDVSGFDENCDNFGSYIDDPPPIPPTATPPEPIRHQCTPCQLTFNTTEDFKLHMLTHTETEKPFICDVCDKTFKRSEELKSHRRVHTGERPYVCHVCQRCFSQPGNLRAHLRTHTGEKPFQCPVCGKSFNRQGNMKTHLRCHSDEKPYQCDKCGKGFKHSCGLKLHVQNVCKDTDELE